MMAPSLPLVPGVDGGVASEGGKGREGVCVGLMRVGLRRRQGCGKDEVAEA